MAWTTSILLSVCCLITQTAASTIVSNSTSSAACAGVSMDIPKVFLSGVNASVTIHLPDYINATTDAGTGGHDGLVPLPEIMLYELYHQGKLLLTGNISRDERTTGHEVFFNISGNRGSEIQLYVEGVCDEGNFTQGVFIIPPWISILPPIITIMLAVISKQVLVSLAAGIFLGCLFLYRYNPLDAFLHTYDVYLTNAVADHDHAEILVGTFLLGGLIGVVQKCGGAVGLAHVLRRLAKSRRSSILVAVGMCFLVFFDDYSNILIVGNTLRPVMSASGVSKNKFASIIHSMGPCIASVVPISSWIGVEIGTAKGVMKFLNTTEEPFIFVVQTIPYRFFPMIMLLLPLIMGVIGRDFGPMLHAEIEATRKHASVTNRNTVRYGTFEALNNEASNGDTDNDTDSTDGKDDEDVSAGALEPKKGIPYRWINSAAPFLIVMVVTFVGMVFDGKRFVDQHPKSGLKHTLVDYVGNCDAVAALIWSSALATWVAMAMLLVQKIFSFSEFMEAWALGVKELLEPILILISAWALGNIVADVQASPWVASSIPPSFKVEVIPILASVLACVMSYATGSAFGTMSILFPLIVPLVGQKTHNMDLVHQAGGAIFGGAIFGNVVAPIADNTILTTLSAPIGLTEHLKSQTPYVLVTVACTVVFGDVMVAFGLYPAYVGLLLCVLLLALVTFAFGSSPLQPDDKSYFLKALDVVCGCVRRKQAAREQKLRINQNDSFSFEPTVTQPV